MKQVVDVAGSEAPDSARDCTILARTSTWSAEASPEPEDRRSRSLTLPLLSPDRSSSRYGSPYKVVQEVFLTTRSSHPSWTAFRRSRGRLLGVLLLPDPRQWLSNDSKVHSVSSRTRDARTAIARAVTTPVLKHRTTITARCTAASACRSRSGPTCRRRSPPAGRGSDA
jgi:hypothetical protein